MVNVVRVAPIVVWVALRVAPIVRGFGSLHNRGVGGAKNPVAPLGAGETMRIDYGYTSRFASDCSGIVGCPIARGTTSTGANKPSFSSWDRPR